MKFKGIKKISRRELFRLGGAIFLSSMVYGICHGNRTGRWNPEEYKGRIKTRDYSVKSEIELVIVKNGDPVRLIREGLEKIGGIDKFIKRGDKVSIKPNIGWDRPPIMAANTNPEMIEELVKQCRDAGAKEVIVGDVSCNDPKSSYKRSGIEEAVKRGGGKVIYPEHKYLVEMDIGGIILSKFPVFKELLEVDKIINIAIAKHHTLAGYTGVMKNWYGIIAGRRFTLHQDLPLSIVEFAKFIKPTLCIVDGYRVLVRNGPQGGSISDTRLRKTVIVSVDQVLADIEGVKLIDKAPEDIPYIEMAISMGIGKGEVEEGRRVVVEL